MNDPSMAIFRNISISNCKSHFFVYLQYAKTSKTLVNPFFVNIAGKFLLEIRSVKNPDIHISSQSIQICKQIYSKT